MAQWLLLAWYQWYHDTEGRQHLKTQPLAEGVKLSPPAIGILGGCIYWEN